ncbi:hypothetical protein PAPYR_4980 [Paratrimastix pyriformis]|uniref:Calcineurin-like phosphoesterase domain-containing protein n=1 Tax=Paratrimastix pyriformis TaxID=342808 RepID=A0ABQ8UIX6_9EUKA|nr:hypothetical protein PAPYR_4980 [Paratrimastix pyriformis]
MAMIFHVFFAFFVLATWSLAFFSWNWRTVRKMHSIALILFPLHLLCVQPPWPKISLPFLFLLQTSLIFRIISLKLRPSLVRSAAYRALIGVPASITTMANILSVPSFLASFLFRIIRWNWATKTCYSITCALALSGLLHNFSSPPTIVDVDMSHTPATPEAIVSRSPHPFRRLSSPAPATSRGRTTLRIAHIADTHCGIFMQPQRLHDLLRRTVEEHPDLVLITGDILSTDLNLPDDAPLIFDILSPLAALPPGRCLACPGNHDQYHPQRDVIEAAYRRHGVRMLHNESCLVRLPLADQGREVTVPAGRGDPAAERTPGADPDAALRVVLLHDPKYFGWVPLEYRALVLSGHTHGGQVSLQALGIPLSFVRLFLGQPDRGLFHTAACPAQGNTLYVHPGNGNFDVPMRILTPAQEVTLRVAVPTPTPSPPPPPVPGA